MSLTRFNIRVYGLLVENGQVLVSDELIKGKRVTKFPGGGLELGEGTSDCLMREVQEEMGLQVDHMEHFYTTDFFQASAYSSTDQIISIYYRMTIGDHEGSAISTVPFGDGQGEQWFRWLRIDDATEEDVDLPIDRVVMRMLIDKQRAGSL